LTSMNSHKKEFVDIVIPLPLLLYCTDIKYYTSDPGNPMARVGDSGCRAMTSEPDL
jgi:hypothetical protein